MACRFSFLKTIFRLSIVVFLVGGIASGGFLWMKYRPVQATESATEVVLPHIDWDARRPDVIQLPNDYTMALRVRTTVVRPAPPPQPLRLRGSLMFDANRLARVKSFFPGQVVSIGKSDPSKRRAVKYMAPATMLQKNGDAPDTLRYGDFVHKGQVLAIVWSQTVGEKKSELVDAISRLETDRRLFDRYRKVERGVVAQKDYDNARRNVEQDVIAVEKAERTLRSWQLSEDDINAVYHEAQRIRQRKAEELVADRRQAKNDADAAHWAETAIRAPIDGIIMERNVSIGDVIDNATDLFKVIDLSLLQVMANVHEEDLAALRRLPPERKRWKVSFPGAADEKPIECDIDRVVKIIDTTQHTGLVSGWLPNDKEDRLVGEFVTAVVDLPPDSSLVAIPSSALIEEGDVARILVAVEGSHLAFTPRQIAVVERGRQTVLIRAEPNAEEKQRGARPLHIGEEVVTTGNLQLAAELANFKASPAGR